MASIFDKIYQTVSNLKKKAQTGISNWAQANPQTAQRIINIQPKINTARQTVANQIRQTPLISMLPGGQAISPSLRALNIKQPTVGNTAIPYVQNWIQRPLTTGVKQLAQIPSQIRQRQYLPAAKNVLGGGFNTFIGAMNINPAFGVPWATYEALKAQSEARKKGLSIPQSFERARQGFVGQRQTGLGTAMTPNTLLEKPLNVGEMAVPLGMMGYNVVQNIRNVLKGAKLTPQQRLAYQEAQLSYQSNKAPIDLLVSHEPFERKTVDMYKIKIAKGEKIDPLIIVNEGKKYGIEDGKNRLQAFKELGFTDVPTIFKGGQEYKRMMEAQSNIKIPEQPKPKGVIPKVEGEVGVKAPILKTKPPQGVKIKQTVPETVQDISKPTGYTPLKIKSTSVLQQAEKLKASSPKSQVADSLPNTITKSEIDVKNKVNLIDYLRTPDRVMRKIGLGKEMDTLRTQYEKYLKELPLEIDKVTQWSKKVSPQSNQKIFRYLDGQDIQLKPNELKVANEVKTYLSGWAERLDLPKDKRISQYITHIFEKDFIKKEFDPELAKIIQNKIPGSVYDPFLEQRLGKMGYVEDTWRALDAYVKRATRKANIDIALKPIKDKAQNLEISQFNYVKKYIDNVNLRPSDLDNLIDNTIKSVAGYRFGQRPTASLTRTGRQAVYRGALGLNIGSATKNLTQGVNTYAKLGEKYTLKGYWDLLLKGTKELDEHQLLKQDLIQDRSLSATRKFWEKVDKGLFVFFETAEKINRGSAYYGAKAKALNQGFNEQQAVEYAKKMVRDTQFTFGSIDTPVALQSDIAKLVAQFQTFSMKQVEFLGEMAKNKEYAGLLRFALGSLAVASTLGKLIGMEWKDFIPSFRIGVPPTLGTPIEIGKSILGVPDKYGNVPDTQEKLRNIGRTLVPYIPAGVQMKKSLEGLTDVGQGYSETQSGMMKYPVEKSSSAYLRAGLFGRYNLPETQQYYQEKRSPLGQKQSARVKAGGKAEYEKIINKREQDNAKEKAIEAFLNGDRETAQQLQQSTKFKVKSSEIKSAAKKKAIEAFLQGDRETAKQLQQKYKFKVTKKDIYGK